MYVWFKGGTLFCSPSVAKPIRHNPGVSLPLIISGHGFCGYPWLSRSGGGPFSSAAREDYYYYYYYLLLLLLLLLLLS